MKILYLLCFVCIHTYGQSQEFSTYLFFEDASGTKDSLLLGYDAAATDNFDAQFDEVNIITEPWKESFEVRFIDWENFTMENLNFEEWQSTGFHAKKQIYSNHCMAYYAITSCVNLHKPQFPVKVYYNKQDFQQSCTNNSFITDWHPSGWFDHTVGNIVMFDLKNQDTVVFHDILHNYTFQGDTNYVLFVELMSEYNIKIGIDNVPNQREMSISFSNDTKTITFEKPCYEITIFNMYGVPVFSNPSPASSIVLTGYVPGVYIVEYMYNSKKYRAKVIL